MERPVDVVQLVRELDEQSATHPHLCRAWKEFILTRHDCFREELARCRAALSDMARGADDLSPAAMLLLRRIASVESETATTEATSLNGWAEDE